MICAKCKIYERKYNSYCVSCHREKSKEARKRYYLKNKMQIIEYSKEYQKNNKEKVSKYTSKWNKTSLNYKISTNLRSRLYRAIKGNFKSGSAVSDLGCSIESFKQYIEQKFTFGMTWENWSRTGWHIDHIIPISSFNLSNREEFLKAVHYTNLQPMWSKDNIVKSNKYR